MKKLLLLFTLLTAALGSASADTYTAAIAKGDISSSNLNWAVNNVNWTFNINWGSVTSKTVSWDGSGNRGYQIGSKKNPATSYTISTSDISGTITKVTVEATAGANANLSVKVGNTDFTTNNSTSATLTSTSTAYLFTGSASGEIQISYTGITGATYFKSVTVEYSQGAVEPTTVTFTPAAGTYAEVQKVEITSDGHDAAGAPCPIYYTTDGTIPTETSSLYEKAITVYKSMTIKAIAVGATSQTEVFEAAYTINLVKPDMPVVTFSDGSTIENDEVSIEKGTSITISSVNANSITIVDQDDNTQTVENPYTFTPEIGEYLYTIKGINGNLESDEVSFYLVVNRPSIETVYTGLLETATECDWTFTTDNLPSALTNVWTWKSYNGKHYLNASGYASGQSYDITEYAYSPVIDLTDYSDATVTFDQAAKFQANLKEGCRLVVREEGATEWTEFTPLNWPEINTWNFSTAGNIGITEFAGKKVEIGFKYVSTSDGADTWEVRNVVVTGKVKEVEPVAPAAPVIEGMVNGSLNAAPGTTVTITGEEGSIVYVKETRQDEPAIYAANADVDGWMTDNANTYVYTIPEYSAIVEAKSVRDGLESPVEVFNVGDGTITTGIEAVVADGAEGEAEYFNLQGIRVANPQGGVFIRRQGAKVAKVAL